jgi:hypothetical protein
MSECDLSADGFVVLDAHCAGERVRPMPWPDRLDGSILKVADIDAVESKASTTTRPRSRRVGPDRLGSTMRTTYG